MEHIFFMTPFREPKVILPTLNNRLTLVNQEPDLNCSPPLVESAFDIAESRRVPQAY
jgi:hypothetical protein